MSKEQQNDLTEQEKLFLSLLFETNEEGQCCHPEQAKLMAGYDKKTPLLTIVRKLNKEILQRGDDFLAIHSPVAIAGLLSVMHNPTEPGAKIRLQAIESILDRSGIVKKEKQEVAQDAPNYIFLIPNKTKIED